MGERSHGEYLYYGEIDSRAVKEDGTGDLSIAEIFLQVDVSFERDVIGVANSNLNNYRSGKYERFLIDQKISEKPISEFKPKDLSSLVESSDFVSVLDVGESSFSTLNIYGDIGIVFFEYNKILESRVTEITVWSKGAEINIGWMHQRFLTLVEEYHQIPMSKFTGAPRD